MENRQLDQLQIAVGHSWDFKLKCILANVGHTLRYFTLLGSECPRFRVERGRLFIEWRKAPSWHKVSKPLNFK